MKITDILQQKKNPERLSVYIDNRFSFGALKRDVGKMGLYVDREINPGEYEILISQAQYAKARDYCAALLGARMYTCHELRRKMLAKQFNGEAVEQVLQNFVSQGYIDDIHYAAVYISEKSRLNNRSLGQIKAELSRRGVSLDDWEEGLKRSREQEDIPEEEDKAEAILSKKLRGEDISSQDLYKKLYAFLRRKGFSHDSVRHALKKHHK